MGRTDTDFMPQRDRAPDLAGTPLYLAPEILEGGHATIQSDLYNVGVLLYHLVTGSFPLHAESLDAVRAVRAVTPVARTRPRPQPGIV